VTLRGDGSGAHTLAYTAVSFKNDTMAVAERAKGEDSIAPLSKLPHGTFFGGGVVINVGDETIGAIGGAGDPGAKLEDGCARAGLEKNSRSSQLDEFVLHIGRIASREKLDVFDRDDDSAASKSPGRAG
jgi:hypothetical protein